MRQFGYMCRSLLLAAALVLFGAVAASADPVRGGTLTMMLSPEPPSLVSGLNSASPVYNISPKMFDGLVTYDKNFKLLPQLATSWEVAPDGLSITFHLRDGVKWHDGQPFTSADVQFSFMELLKKYHSRGISTFQNLTAVDIPDDHTAIFRLSTPSPYIMRALAAAESPIMPKHIYEGKDPLTNPANVAPVGTGPFKFGEWKRGNYLILVRNPNYWDAPKPYLDRIIYRFIPDAAARAVALESGEVQYGTQYVVPLNDVARLGALPNLQVTTEGYEYNTSVNYLEFNLRRPVFKDVRVREAIAHAIDKNFLLKNIWFGFASAATSPITDKQVEFHTDDVPKYDYDLAKAESLLDEAGFKRGADGIRFHITLDYNASGDMYQQTADYLKQSLAKIGIAAEIRTQDSPTYLRRIWTQYDFDLNIYTASNIADPAIGIQGFYWSKGIQPGVPFSNGSGYASPEMDRILETAQKEKDPKKRQQLYWDMQRLEMTDLPNFPLVYVKWYTIYDKRLHNLNSTGLGPYENFAEVYMDH